MLTESSIENQVTYQLQATANNTLMVIENEVKSIDEFVEVTDSTLGFITSIYDTVSIYQADHYLMIDRSLFDGSDDNTSYYLKIGTIQFDTTFTPSTSSTILNVSVNTISSESQQFDPNKRFQAFAERSIFLRNMKISNS
jgi:hypothetical protein